MIRKRLEYDSWDGPSGRDRDSRSDRRKQAGYGMQVGYGNGRGTAEMASPGGLE